MYVVGSLGTDQSLWDLNFKVNIPTFCVEDQSQLLYFGICYIDLVTKDIKTRNVEPNLQGLVYFYRTTYSKILNY